MRQGRHLVCLARRGDELVWLDGRRSFPTACGPCSAEAFVETAAAALRGLVAAVQAETPDAVFSVLALTAREPPPRGLLPALGAGLDDLEDFGSFASAFLGPSADARDTREHERPAKCPRSD